MDLQFVGQCILSAEGPCCFSIAIDVDVFKDCQKQRQPHLCLKISVFFLSQNEILQTFLLSSLDQ